MEAYNVSLFNIAHSIGMISDLVDNKLTGHHRRVAYIAGRIAKEFNLSIKEQDEIILAGLVHDIGALSTEDRVSILNFREGNGYEHAERGYRLLRLLGAFEGVAKVVKYHHTRWDERKDGDGGLSGHILHLADRIDSLVKADRNILLQTREIRGKICEEKGTMFMPEVVEAFINISKKEAFWLDIISSTTLEVRSKEYKSIALTEDVMLELGLFFSQLIDFRCRFTATHSSGIAAVSSELAKFLGYDEYDCMLMRFAGHVHDIGKLAVPIEIIEKPSKLTNEEYSLMKMHTYYTYQILSHMNEIEKVREWASYHHEKVDGTGYPFGIKGDEMNEGCKIMKVADVFTALTEDRPYRTRMKKEEVVAILETLIEGDEEFHTIVTVLKNNYNALESVRESAQKDAIYRYEYLFNRD